MIEISLNNEPCTLAANTSVAAALAEWGFEESGMIAVAINQTFLPRQRYHQTLLCDQDQVDIVQPISGG